MYSDPSFSEWHRKKIKCLEMHFKAFFYEAAKILGIHKRLVKSVIENVTWRRPSLSVNKKSTN